MPSIAKLKEIQARSGLHFAFFLILHFICHYSLSLGLDVAHSNLLLFRKLYQHRLFESLLTLSVIGHMYANVALYLKRRQTADKKEGGSEPVAGSMELKAHRIAGYIMGFSIFGHVATTRFGPKHFMDDPSEYDYSFIAKANELLPSNIFLVFLAIFGMAGGWHMIYGIRSAVATFKRESIVGKPFPIALKVLALASHVGIISAVIALGGYYYPIDTESNAEIHDQLYDKLFGPMGIH